jgi:hypothetical protein
MDPYNEINNLRTDNNDRKNHILLTTVIILIFVIIAVFTYDYINTKYKTDSGVDQSLMDELPQQNDDLNSTDLSTDENQDSDISQTESDIDSLLNSDFDMEISEIEKEF